MNRPRVALGLEASRATLNADVCADLGRQLAAARRDQALEIQDVASRLLLSPRQVTALEAADQEAFYGADFYVAALRKYAVLLGVDSGLVNQALVRPDALSSAPPFKRGRRASDLPAVNIPRPRRRVIVAVGLAVTTLVAWLLVSAVHSGPPATPEASAATDPAPADVPVPAATTPSAAVVQPAAADVVPEEPAQSGAPDDATVVGRVRVSQGTWIFVRYADNSTVEQRLGSGEEFVLHRAPVYLVVGSADKADVEIAGHTIDNTRFTTNGQLRVGSSYLARLVTTSQ
jgi:hypothetical protein